MQLNFFSTKITSACCYIVSVRRDLNSATLHIIFVVTNVYFSKNRGFKGSPEIHEPIKRLT